MSNSTGCGVISKRITILHLEVDVGVDEVLVEDAAGGQIGVVGLEGCRAPRAASRRPSGSPSTLPRQVVEVLVGRRAPIDLVRDAVEARHQHGGEGEIGFAVGSGKRTSMRFAFGSSRRDAAGGERLRDE